MSCDQIVFAKVTLDLVWRAKTESESDKEASAVSELRLGVILNWKQTEMETCV